MMILFCFVNEDGPTYPPLHAIVVSLRDLPPSILLWGQGALSICCALGSTQGLLFFSPHTEDPVRLLETTKELCRVLQSSLEWNPQSRGIIVCPTPLSHNFVFGKLFEALRLCLLLLVVGGSLLMFFCTQPPESFQMWEADMNAAVEHWEKRSHADEAAGLGDSQSLLVALQDCLQVSLLIQLEEFGIPAGD